MKNISSFTLSILTHAAILLAIFFAYQGYKHTVQSKETAQEKYICIQTKQFVAPTPKKEKEHKKKRVTKPKKSQEKPKKVEKKEKKHKKVIKKQTTKKKRTLQEEPKLQKKTEKKKESKTQETKEKEIKEQKCEQEVKKRVKEKPDEIIPAKLPEEPKPAPQVQQKPKSAQPSPVTTPVVKKEYSKEYIDKNLAKIRELIQENIYYPRKARRRNIEGKVVLRFTITTAGTIQNVQVVSSAHNILTHAAKQVLIMIEDELPKPKEEIEITLPLTYTLR